MGFWNEMRKLWRARRRAPLVVSDMDELLWPKLGLDEVVRAFEGHEDDPTVRAVAQLLCCQRYQNIDAAEDFAGRDNDRALYETGGSAAIREVISNILKLTRGEVPGEVREWFSERPRARPGEKTSGGRTPSAH